MTVDQKVYDKVNLDQRVQGKVIAGQRVHDKRDFRPKDGVREAT